MKTFVASKWSYYPLKIHSPSLKRLFLFLHTCVNIDTESQHLSLYKKMLLCIGGQHNPRCCLLASSLLLPCQPCPRIVLICSQPPAWRGTSSVTWAWMELAGMEITACQKDLFVLQPVTTQHHQHVLILQMLSVIMGWMQMVAGWETCACQLVTLVLWSVLLFPHLTAPAQKYCVTWAWLAPVGMEITACQKDRSVHPPAIPRIPPSVPPLMWDVTTGWTVTGAGWGTPVYQKETSVPHPASQACHQSVQRLMWGVTWEWMEDAGMEITACLKDQSVLQPATPLLPQSVDLQMWDVILVWPVLAGTGTTACLRDLFVPKHASHQNPPLVLILQILSVTTGWTATDAGWETFVCLPGISALLSALLSHHPTAPAQRLCVIWAWMDHAGMETTACQKDQFAHQPAWTQLPLFVAPQMWGVIWAWMVLAGMETIACQRDLSVWVEMSNKNSNCWQILITQLGYYHSKVV